MNNSKHRSTRLIAHLATIGPGGSGKTRMINSLANLLEEKELYPWDEEKQMAGTIAVTPYTLRFPTGKVIISDNPGQDSFEKIRNIIAHQGSVYDGYVVCIDAIGWIFKDIAISQLKHMSEAESHDSLTLIAVIVNKRDLLELLLTPELLKSLSKTMSKAIQSIYHGMEVKFKDRVFNKEGTLHVELINENIIPFTVAEQVLVNAIESWCKQEELQALTLMNCRLLVRSFLLGYSYAMKKNVDLSKWPMFASINDPSLANRCNYHRPTAFETGSGWEKLSGKNKEGDLNIEEPPILKNALREDAIEIILKEYVFVSEIKFQGFINEMNKLGQIYKWCVISCIFSNSFDKNGINSIKNCLSGMVASIDTVKTKSQLEVDLVSTDDVTSLGLENF